MGRPVKKGTGRYMNISGPIQSNLPTVQEKTDQFLKVNQRIAGEIIEIANEQVVLAVNGVQIVAKMTSAEQLANLMEKRYAFFVVKEVNENQITLQLTSPTATSPEAKQAAENNPLGRSLLEQFGLPIDKENIQIVQAMLNRGMEISPKVLNSIRQVLDANPGWGMNEVQLATAIKSAGLPLTEESLKLAMYAVKDIHTSFLALNEQLSLYLYRPGIQPNANQMIRSTLEALKNVLIQGGDSQANLEKALQLAVKGLGTSIENEIGKIIDPKNREIQSSKESNILYDLATLKNVLGDTARPLSNAIDNFLNGMKWIHFQNVEPELDVPKGQWTQLDLPISFNTSISNQQPNIIYNMKIRVANESDKENGNQINPNYTRLVIEVDLEEDENIKVDLSIVSKMVGAEITATDEDICTIASEELDELKTGLSNLGYTLKTSRIELGSAVLEMDLNESGKTLPKISSIDLGV